MQGAAAAWVEALALEALARGDVTGPDPVAVALRAYATRGDDRVAGHVGLALARALEAAADPAWRPAPTAGRRDAASERAAWLALFIDAAPLTDDDRLPALVSDLAGQVAAGWPAEIGVGPGLRAVAACLRAASEGGPEDLAARAVDEMERVIGQAYRPGAGVSTTAGEPARVMDDHVQAAMALLSAYALTARLPYAMLADDLMQFARRSWWPDVEAPPVGSLADFAVRCEAVRVHGRLALVHADAGYREAAVMTEHDDPLADAERLLAALAPQAASFGLDGCGYAVAAMEIEDCRLKIGD